MKTSTILTTTLFALTGIAQAVTFNLAGDWLADEEGIQGIPNGSLIMLVASTQDNSFSPPSSRGLIDPDSDDVILGMFSASDDNGRSNRGSYAASIQANFNDERVGLQDFDGGDPLLIRWFPTLTSASLDAVSGSIPYGEFRADDVLYGSNSPWVTPGANSATINLSIVADAIGNRYNPQGPLPVKQLAARGLVERAVLHAAQAHLTISALSNGSLALSWPLLEGAEPVGRLQKSVDLLNWSDVPVKVDLSVSGQASAVTDTGDTVQFFRIATSQGE